MKKTYFLTSTPVNEDRSGLCSENQLIEELQKVLHADMRALFVSSDPDNPGNDAYAADIRGCFAGSGFTFSEFAILDARTEAQAEDLVAAAEFIILAGGHVPTQNAFLNRMHLRELLAKSDAVIFGFSAGSMNMADIVYAMPELEGEAVSGSYQRFLPGLGLTKTMIIPHFQYIRGERIDHLRAVEDIALPDSVGREFTALVDGAYIRIEDGRETVCGEAYRIREGRLSVISVHAL